ncbi:hypothetical protein GCM10022246_24720 [Pedobacter ginsengiterrae]|uniref:Bacterial EndoU nuclease domain-containing protein n=1 Tax=Pedobacter ginsengiterrae TaxID=871696 RepID=A0ABP7PUJ1_9SPHI
MAVVILKNDGMAVDLDATFTELAFDIEGFILEFNYLSNPVFRYKYYQTGDFKQKDRYLKDTLNGYFLEREYLNYTNDEDSEIKVFVKKHKFISTRFAAKVGDEVFVNKVDSGEPFSFYFNVIRYRFLVEATLNSGIKKYLGKIFEGNKLIGYEVAIPDIATSVVNPSAPKNLASRYFFNNNYTRYLSTWIDDNTKKNIKKFTILISFRIAEIYNEIFPKIASVSLWASIDSIANTISGNADSLTDYGKLLFELKKSWGYYHDPNADQNYIHKHDFEPVFQDGAAYEDYEKYYNGLTELYFALYKIQDKLIEFSEDLRLRYILEILPLSALATIPYAIVKEQLFFYYKLKELPQNSQRYLVHLIISMTQRNNLANDFLTLLLKKENGSVTIFEVLYLLLDDGRLERYPIVNWFVNQQTNRKHFVYAIYEIWKISEFNFYFIPNGVTANEDGLNPDTYFLKQGKKYYPKYSQDGKILHGANPILEFSISKVDNQSNQYYNLVSNEITYKPTTEFIGEKVIINKVTKSTYSNYNPYGTNTQSFQSTEIKYGEYHLYQPISLIGYTSNLDLNVPNFLPIPVFLFYYAVEFDELKDFDASILFAAEVSLELAIFYFTGGLSTMRHLRYLKYISEINNVKNDLVSLETAVLFWRGVDAGSEIVSLTAGVLSSFFAYQEQIANNTDLKNLNKKLSLFFMLFAIGSAGNAIYSSKKTSKAADDVLEELEYLSDFGIPHNLPNDVLLVINKVRGLAQVSKALFRNRIVSLAESELDEANHIASLYDNFFSDVEREAFWQDFVGKVEKSPLNDSFWKLMNETQDGIPATRTVIWRECPRELLNYRKNIWFLDGTLVIKKSEELNNELFVGRAGKKLKDGAIPPYSLNDYTYGAHGVHYKSALRNINPSSLGDIVGNVTPLGDGFYSAKIRVWNIDLGNWKMKKNASTFFPDNWSELRVQSEIVIASRNRIRLHGNVYLGIMSDGKKIRFHIEKGVIKSAYPDL